MGSSSDDALRVAGRTGPEPPPRQPGTLAHHTAPHRVPPEARVACCLQWRPSAATPPRHLLSMRLFLIRAKPLSPLPVSRVSAGSPGGPHTTGESPDSAMPPMSPCTYGVRNRTKVWRPPLEASGRRSRSGPLRTVELSCPFSLKTSIYRGPTLRTVKRALHLGLRG